MSTNSAPRRKPLWRRFLNWALVVVILLAALVAFRAYFAFRDRLDGYTLAVAIDSTKAIAEPRPLRAGFARVSINPDLSDPKRPVWLAGFSQNRAATRIHDDLWAVGCVLDDGWTRIGFVALDAIGFFQDDVVEVRRRLENKGLHFITVCSTHNHSTPDLMGLWGPSIFRSGVDPAYREKVISACVEALSVASSKLEPARMSSHQIAMSPEGLVADTRKPEVYDQDIRVMHFTREGDGSTIGSVVNWGNHPETPWSQNKEITADYCGYLREALANGVVVDGKEFLAGVGGIHLFVNGAVGGLMSTTPSIVVRDPFLDKEYKMASHEKSRAVGHVLAAHVLPRLKDASVVRTNCAPITVRAQSFPIPLHNHGYLLAGFLGLLDRGYVGWRQLRTEAALITIGEASIACVPGEIYPEIANGGIERPDGADFDVPVVETPPLREMMPGRVKFVFGLANDEIGYILPKSQWDEKPPYTYGNRKAPYGEVNSVGPDVGPILHAAFKEMCGRKSEVRSAKSEVTKNLESSAR